MATIQEVRSAYTRYINSGRQANDLQNFSQIAATFVREARANGMSQDEIIDQLFNASWDVADRSITRTATVDAASSAVTFSEAPTNNRDLVEARQRFMAEITAFVRQTLGANRVVFRG